jgi:hypothetical protein
MLADLSAETSAMSLTFDDSAPLTASTASLRTPGAGRATGRRPRRARLVAHLAETPAGGGVSAAMAGALAAVALAALLFDFAVA